MAVGQGFEPRDGYKPSAVFKTAAFSHSASPPFPLLSCDSGVHHTGIACAVNAPNKIQCKSVTLTAFNGIQSAFCSHKALKVGNSILL